MNTNFPLSMSRTPQPGQMVHWRNPRHAKALGWAEALGSGPFEVVKVVDKSLQDLPQGVVLRTKLGLKEINEVWLS